MSIDYNEYLERMIVEIADRQSGEEIESINLRIIHQQRFSDCPSSWLQSLPTELHSRGFGVDWQDTSNESFRPNGNLFSKAAEIRGINKVKDDSIHIFPVPLEVAKWKFWKQKINWSKWGAVAAILAIPTMIILWWIQ